MGLLKETSTDNILIKNGFESRDESIVGTLKFCYTKFIPVSSLYDAFVSVDLDGNVEIYVEYECGGEVSTIHTHINTDWDYDEEGFFNELDKTATFFLETYK